MEELGSPISIRGAGVEVSTDVDTSGRLLVSDDSC